MSRLLLAILILTLLEFYLIKKVNRIVENPNSTNYKRIRLSLLIFINLFPLFGSIHSWLRPAWINTEAYWIDLFLKFPFWVSFLFMLQLALILLSIDAIKWPIIWWRKKLKVSVLKIEKNIISLVFIFFLIYMPFRIIYDWNVIDVDQFTFSKVNLAKDLDGFRIALISDLQADKYTNGDRLQKYIDLVNEQKPDLILIAGDLITSTPKYIEIAASYVGQLRAPYGIYSSVGDHDNWSYRGNNQKSLDTMRNALNVYDVPLIDNDTLNIRVGDATIHHMFLTYTYSNRQENGRYTDLLNGSKKSDLNIVVSHQPRPFLVEWVEASGYDMFLAGHTHGGQITFLYPFMMLSPTQFETPYVKEDYWFKELFIVISKGIGASFVPFRLNATPNISIITIHSK